jgi:hypothetical protein
VSAYDEEEIGILVAKRLDADPADVLRFVPLVPAGILRTVRKCAARPGLRHLVWTDPASTTAALDGSGVADLSTLVTSTRIQLDLLKYGEIRHAGYDFPLRLLENSGQGAFSGSLDTLFPKCWLTGQKLSTRVSSETNLLPGPLSLAVPYWMTLAQLPEPLVELEGVGLVDSIIDLLRLAPEEEGGDK